MGPEYFYFIDTSLPAGRFSLVVRGGDDGFSCYVEGNNVIFFDSQVTTGYQDGIALSIPRSLDERTED